MRTERTGKGPQTRYRPKEPKPVSYTFTTLAKRVVEAAAERSRKGAAKRGTRPWTMSDIAERAVREVVPTMNFDEDETVDESEGVLV